MYTDKQRDNILLQERNKALARNGLKDSEYNNMDDKYVYLTTGKVPKFDLLKKGLSIGNNNKNTKTDNTPITNEMLYNRANVAIQKYGVTNITPAQLAALGKSQMQWESSLGTKGRAVDTNNPANVGNTETDSKYFNTIEEGVDNYYDFLFKYGYLSKDKDIDAMLTDKIRNRSGNNYIGKNNPNIDTYTNNVRNSYNKYLKDFSVLLKENEVVDKKQTGGKVRIGDKVLTIDSPEYKQLYNEGKLATYDKDNDIYIAPPFKEYTITTPKPRFMVYKEQEEKAYTPNMFIDKELPKYSRGLGISGNNLGGNKTNYDKAIMERVADRLISDSKVRGEYEGLPTTYKGRLDYGNQYTNKELDILLNSRKYNKQGQRLIDARNADRSDKIQKESGVLGVLSDADKLEQVTKGTEAKLKLSNRVPAQLETLAEYVDMINPVAEIGTMTKGLGTIPKNIKESKYLEATKNLLAPVMAGLAIEERLGKKVMPKREVYIPSTDITISEVTFPTNLRVSSLTPTPNGYNLPHRIRGANPTFNIIDNGNTQSKRVAQRADNSIEDIEFTPISNTISAPHQKNTIRQLEKNINESLKEGLGIKKDKSANLKVKLVQADNSDRYYVDTYINNKFAGNITLKPIVQDGIEGYEKHADFPLVHYKNSNANKMGIGAEFGQAVNTAIKKEKDNKGNQKRLFSSTEHTVDMNVDGQIRKGGQSRYLQDFVRDRVELVSNSTEANKWLEKANTIKQQYPNLTKDEAVALLEKDKSLSPDGFRFIYKSLFPATVGTKLYLGNQDDKK
jgi:hypothetical protein